MARKKVNKKGHELDNRRAIIVMLVVSLVASIISSLCLAWTIFNIDAGVVLSELILTAIPVFFIISCALILAFIVAYKGFNY